MNDYRWARLLPNRRNELEYKLRRHQRSVGCGLEAGMCPIYNSGSSGSPIYTQTALSAYEVAINIDNTFASGGGAVLSLISRDVRFY